MESRHHDLAELVASLDADADSEMISLRNSGDNDLLGYSILQGVSDERKRTLVEQFKGSGSPELDRAMGALCGLGIGDALGAPFEFIPASDTLEPSHFDLHTMEFHSEFNKFHLERGQWTDDTSMGLCMADSLIMRRSMDGSDMRMRFWCWWFRAYNNGFRNDTSRESKASIGLGGNVRKSLEVLETEREQRGQVAPTYEAGGDDAGNGSLMRLAPVPLFFCHAPPHELHGQARASSYTTHPGLVAAEACALLAHLVARAVVRPNEQPLDVKSFLRSETQAFLTSSGLSDKSGPGYDEVKWLVTSNPTRDMERCWNWKADKLEIQATLTARGWEYNGYPVTADYFGSYSLDGLAVALWSVYHTTSFDEAVARAVNFLGDADSNASITGQLAGALYGYSSINEQFLAWQSKWDGHELAVRALLLLHLGQERLRTVA